MTDPTTGLHYAPNGNLVNGVYAPGADGFNLADVSSVSGLNSLPAGVKGLVWLGMTDGVTAAFQSAVELFASSPQSSKVYGFYLADEPLPSATTAANLKAESDWIHANFPGAKTFIVQYNSGSDVAPQFYYTPANTDIDLFGLDPYPVQTNVPNNYDLNIIPLAVQAAETPNPSQGYAAIPEQDLVPVYQAFGGGGYATYILPTATQEQAILAEWGAVLPNPAFDYAYSWGVQNGDTALSIAPALQAVFATHNAGGVTSAPGVPTIGDSAVQNGVVNKATDIASQALSGTAAAGSTVSVYLNGSTTPAYTTQADASGDWSQTIGHLANGAYSYDATATDAAGASVPSSPLGFTVDTTPPRAPTIRDQSIHNGVVSSANDIASQALSGTAEAGSTVRVYLKKGSTTPVYTATANLLGRWSVTIGMLATGSYSFTATATDAAGNVSATSSPLSFTAIDPPAPAPSASTTVPRYDHIVVVVEENHDYSQIIGDTTDAPYINNTLVAGGTLLTNYDAITHPSEANYFALYAGSTFNISPDDPLVSEPDPTIYTTLHAAGLTFQGYVDTAGGSSYDHNPWTSFPEGQGSTPLVGTDFTNFPASGNYSSLPTVSYVTPGVNDDMHDGTIAQGDTWLNNNLNAYAQWVKANNSLLIVTWDENDGTSDGNHVATILYGAGVQAGATNATAYNHYNLLSTILASYGLTGPNNAAAAAPIDVFSSSASPPGAPTIGDSAVHNGVVNAANDTSSQALSGTAAAGSTIKVYLNGSTTPAYTTTANATTGAWSQTIGVLANGSYSYTATATNTAGTSSPSTALSFTVDTTAPGVPTIGDSAVQNGVVSAANDTTSQALSGTAAAGSTVNVYLNGSTTPAYTTTANATTGAWSQTIGVLANGSYSYTATATDAAGNVSAPSSALSFTVNATVPGVPTIGDSAVHSGDVNAANDTSSQALSGTAAAGSTVKVYLNGSTTPAYTTTANATTGAWSQTIGVLANGSYSYTATATDAAGNVSAPSTALSFTVDTTAPGVPTIGDSAVQNGVVSAANDTTSQALSGTAAAGSTVNVYLNGSTTPAYTTTANATTGAWSQTIGVLANGSYSYTATATNTAGTSSPSTALSFTVDMTAPGAPTIGDSAVQNGVVSAANDTTSQALSGTAAAGSTVNVYLNGSTTPAYTTTANATTGAWSQTIGVLANGSYSYTATATDAAGNVSAPSSALSFTVASTSSTGGQPVTALHYAPNGNIVNGQYALGAGSDGFNLADISSASELSELGSGVKALVWLGDTIGGATAAFQASVNSFVGKSQVYGFYLADEPLASATTAANLKAESDYIHATIPGAKTFIVEDNLGSDGSPSFYYTPANTDVDLFGLDPYPVRSDNLDASGNPDYSIIPTAVSAAITQGIPKPDLVPIYQAFGNLSPWVTPTATQEQQILSTWGSVLPAPAFDYAYSWGVQSGDTALSSDPALQQVFLAHNTGNAGGAASPPSAPTIGDSAVHNGVVNAANDTSSQALSGTAAAGSTVKVYLNGSTTPAYTTTANATTGAWSQTIGVLANGSYSYTATATNTAGTSSPSTALSFTVDMTASGAPTIGDSAVQNGVVSAANDTTSQALSGTAAAGSTVNVYLNGSTTPAYTTTANATTGAWSQTIGVLANGSYSYTATATDAAGNVSAPSTALSFTVDATVPGVPTIGDSAVHNGVVNAANDTSSQALSGTAAAGSTVKVYLNGSTTPAYTTTANATTGAWSQTIGVLANGSYSYTATATNTAGTSSPSTALSFTVDMTASGAPTIGDSAVQNGVVSAANDTTSQALSGTAAAGSTVNVYLNGSTTPAYTTTANATTGAWSQTIGVLANGSYSYTATATDAAGNVSAPSSALSFTVSAPASPPGSLSAKALLTSATEDVALGSNTTIASFTDTNTADLASGFTATINWGDGTATSAGTVVSSGNGTFNVTGGHTYGDEGSEPLLVTITRASDKASVSASGTVVVADADTLTPHATGFTGTAGQALSNVTVASFTDSDTANAAGDFAATITWGDGSTSAGTVSGGAGAFSVTGSHTYAGAGSDAVAVTLTDGGGASATANSTAQIVGGAGGAGGTTISAAVAGQINMTASDNPLTIASTGVVTSTASSADGIDGLSTAPTTVTNFGRVDATGGGWGAGIWLPDGGTVTVGKGAEVSAPYGVEVSGGAGTIISGGTITGSQDAVLFNNSGVDRLVVNPTAVFNGDVEGGSGANTLELAGGTGSITGLSGGSGTISENGTWSFSSFDTLAVDSGGAWTINGGDVPQLANAGTVIVAGALDVSAIDPSSTGLFELDGGTTFDVAAAVGSGAKMAFLGSSSSPAELAIDDYASFGSNIGPNYTGALLEDFTTGDKIDLKSFDAAGAMLLYDPSSGILQLSNSELQHASLLFQNSTLGSGAFSMTSDGGSGLLISHK